MLLLFWRFPVQPLAMNHQQPASKSVDREQSSAGTEQVRPPRRFKEREFFEDNYFVH
jgi:hypothetical protein